MKRHSIALLPGLFAVLLFTSFSLTQAETFSPDNGDVPKAVPRMPTKPYVTPPPVSSSVNANPAPRPVAPTYQRPRYAAPSARTSKREEAVDLNNLEN